MLTRLLRLLSASDPERLSESWLMAHRYEAGKVGWLDGPRWPTMKEQRARQRAEMKAARMSRVA